MRAHCFVELAALPVLPVMPATGPLQVVQLDDVVATVIFMLRPKSPSHMALELAGPEALAMTEIVELYRRWLGWKPARKIALPVWAGWILYRFGDLAGWLGWRPPIRTNAAREIVRGATGDPQPWTMTTGIHPKNLSSALAAAPATVQERWFAGLYFLNAAIFLALPIFWIMTGIVSLTTGWRSGVDILIDTVAGGLAHSIVAVGAGADVIIGTLIAWRPASQTGLWGAIATSLFYAIAGTVLRPDLWNEPLGPLMKILPILTLHFVALAVLEER